MSNMLQVGVDAPYPVWLGADSAGTTGAFAIGLQRPGENPEVATLRADLTAFTNRVMFEVIRSGKLYEHATATLVLNALRPGDTALDVGAHIGFFATLFRLAVGPSGRVFAFEPLPETFRNLLFNVMNNGFTNVLPLPLAVADQPGIAQFHLNSTNEGASSLLQSSESTDTFPVQVSTLDSLFLEAMKTPARLMKMDIEGVELLALQGASSWFDRLPPEVVICEFNRGALALAGTTEWDLRRFFATRNYRCALVNNGTNLDMNGAHYYRNLGEQEAIPFSDENPYVYNLMFVRRDSALFPAEQW